MIRPVQSDKRLLRWISRPVLAVVVVGLLITVALTVGAKAEHDLHAIEKFRTLSSDRIRMVQLSFETQIEHLHSIKSFYAASKFVDSDEFQKFTKNFLTSRSVHSVMWVPSVPVYQRAEFEKTIGRSLFACQPDGAVRPVGERKRYYPVSYAQPAEFSSLIGHDLGTDAYCLSAMRVARDSGKIQITGVVPARTGDTTQHVIMAIAPVYRNGQPAETIEQRNANLHGFLISKLYVGETMEQGLARLRGGGVDLLLYDAPRRVDNRLMYAHLSPSRKQCGDELVCLEDANYVYEERFAVASRQWTMICYQAPSLAAEWNPLKPLIILPIGFCFTLLAAVLTASFTDRHRKVHELVTQRTRELAEANRQARAASKAKTEFLANMSHEIRTPMTAILGFADLLTEPGLPVKEHSSHVETIKRNGDHLLTIINDILDLSKIEAGKLQIERIKVDLCQIVNEVVSLMRVRAGGKGIDLSVDFAFPIPRTIKTDAMRVRQILMNLVGNAIKFTEQGGVKLRVRVGQADDHNATVVVDVIDTGVGIPSDKLANLFSAFEQADYSTTRQYGGSGLGLTISRRLAQMLGGDIEVKSEVGSGSTFTLSMQVGVVQPDITYQNLSEALHEKTPKAQRKERQSLNVRALLVEDGPDNQRLISFLLRKAGCDVELAENGLIGFEKALADGPFDIILMDMQMPQMDGYTATAKLREAGYEGPIVALTAHAMSADREKCLSAGCDDYISKPVSRPQLIKLIDQYARKQPVPASVWRVS